MAITYGMSVREFWEDNPDLFWAYRFSYYNKLKEQQEIFNHNAWLQGAYIYEAISVALHNIFDKQKIDYSKHPYELVSKETNISDKKQKQINMQVADIKARISQVNAIKKKSSTAEKGNTEGGEKTNE